MFKIGKGKYRKRTGNYQEMLHQGQTELIFHPVQDMKTPLSYGLVMVVKRALA